MGGRGEVMVGGRGEVMGGRERGGDGWEREGR